MGRGRRAGGQKGLSLLSLSASNCSSPVTLLPLLPLQVGDVLYLPRGTIHQAVAQEEGSTHLTLSTYQRWTWGDLASSMLRTALESKGQVGTGGAGGAEEGRVFEGGHNGRRRAACKQDGMPGTPLPPQPTQPRDKVLPVTQLLVCSHQCHARFLMSVPSASCCAD